MKIIYLGGCIAFSISCLLMPLFVRLSLKIGAISETGGRHIGSSPVGRLGGVGALFGVISSIFIQAFVDDSLRSAILSNYGQMVGVSVGVVMIAGIGVIDDIYRLPAILKFGVQVITAFITYGCGLRISGLDLPLIEPFILGWFSLPVTVFWIVGLVNAVNLIDGLDGLAGGVLFFAAVVNLVTAVSTGSIIPAALMVSLGGAILGFLLFNWYPAKIYLGDGGAYSFGYILAVSGLLAPVQKASTSIALLVPILAIGLPIIDTFLTVFRRFLGGKGIFSADRGHLHHILLDVGISHRRVVLGMYLFSLVLGSVSLMIVLNRNRKVGYLLFAASVVGSIFWGVAVKSQLRKAMNSIVSGKTNFSVEDTHNRL